MNIEFKNNSLKKILEDSRLLKRNFTKIYEKLANRISELVAANNLSEISTNPPPRRHKLSNGLWAVDCSKNYRILIQPIGEFNLNDLKTIKEIMIINIENYH